MLFADYFGKYRAIVISVAMFIFLDTGVLGLNFYISSQIAADAVNVNLAGRQRMLSQKSVKALLEYRNEVEQGASGAAPFTEMQAAVLLFDRTLHAFNTGGFTQDATGQEIYLAAVETPLAVSTVKESLERWAPIRERFAQLENMEQIDRAFLASLVDISARNNLVLLKLMNDLTVELEAVAKQKSDTLRWIQATAITLAILNFFLILFHFLGQLRRSDALTEAARKETTEIMDTVREGLLLLDAKLIIGSQYSESVKTIFGEQDIAGMSFRNLLHNIAVESDMTTTEEYIKLLLNEQVKENLIVSLNPLADVEISLPGGNGQYSVKHLSFRFNRTIEEGRISHILVTVQDITEMVALRRSLEDARNNQGMQISSLHKLVHLDNSTLTQFLDNTERELHLINDILKDEGESTSSYVEKLQSCFRTMHRIKGDAGALELVQVAAAAHQFEERLALIQKSDQLKGSDFLPLTLALDALMQLMTELREIAELLQSLRSEQSGTNSLPAAAAQHIPLPLDEEPIRRLAMRIAEEYEKEVALSFDVDDASCLSDEQRILVQANVVQLVRNSVVHGVEVPDERLHAGKAPEGLITVKASLEGQGLRISVRDDGHGLDLEGIRRHAEDNGLFSREQLEGFSRTRLMGLIFTPGFSTAAGVDEHAGRGVGMDLVRVNVGKLQGKVRIASQRQRYCEISFLIPSEQLAKGGEVAVAV